VSQEAWLQKAALFHTLKVKGENFPGLFCTYSSAGPALLEMYCVFLKKGDTILIVIII